LREFEEYLRLRFSALLPARFSRPKATMLAMDNTLDDTAKVYSDMEMSLQSMIEEEAMM